MSSTAVTPAGRHLLNLAIDDARFSLLLESKIPVAEVTEPLRTDIYGQVEPLLMRLKEVPGEHQRQALLSKAIIPILVQAMPSSEKPPAASA